MKEVKDYGKQTDKLIELFGFGWGSYRPGLGFRKHAIQRSEANLILAEINGWYNAPYQFEKASNILACHVEMENYSDYAVGCFSRQFKGDVCAVLNAVVLEVKESVQKKVA